MSHQNIHQPSVSERILGGGVSAVIHGIIFAIFALSTGSEPAAEAPKAEETIFCRYIENGRLFNLEVKAANWQEAEETTCGAHLRGVRLPPLLAEGARLALGGDRHPLLLAQRESCSCSKEERVPILQDIGIIEAPRLGTEARKTALPRIINTPEPTAQNTVTTRENNKPKQDKRRKAKTPSIEDLLNSASDFDEARPISERDPGGSLDGSRLSKSAVGKGDPYLQKIKAKLDNTMNAPASIPKSELRKLKARIVIRIGDEGAVWFLEMTKRSGNQAFDKMIEKTISQFKVGGSMRFARPPQNWALRNIPITVDGSDIR